MLPEKLVHWSGGTIPGAYGGQMGGRRDPFIIQATQYGDPFWRGPYLQDGVTPVDPWGAPYRYSFSTDGRVSVTSLGSDGAEGGEGDAADLGA